MKHVLLGLGLVLLAGTVAACKGTVNSSDCKPDTCTLLNKQCGDWPDGCGETLTCGPCDNAIQYCNTEGQCQSCDGHCGDLIQNCGETGVDCGGECSSCSDPCLGHCTDQIQNCGETGLNCGGECNPCPDPCLGHCNNQSQDCGETGVDCGGGECAACPDSCSNHCSNDRRDCGEIGVDCGGECAPCCSQDCGAVYYLAPDQNLDGTPNTQGDDSNDGLSEQRPWKTFDRAVNAETSGSPMQPGDTLILLDGVFLQALLPNQVGGQPGKPITIIAQNDGRAVIDGQGLRTPVYLEGWRGASFYVIEGIVAKNSSDIVIETTAPNNIFRRVSGYNANSDGNTEVFVIWANDTLLEDCVAAGSGRKMIVVFSSSDANGQRNTVRRCFASYREWDGRQWHDEWPWNENFEAYGGDYSVFENDIAYGYFANSGFSLLSNGPDDTNIGNKVLGSMAILGGLDFLGNPILWGNIRPQPAQAELIKDITNPYHRNGLNIGHDGIIKDNLIQDLYVWNNAGPGLGVWGPGNMTNNVLNRVTIFHNGLDSTWGEMDAFSEDVARLTVTNSRIDIIKSINYPNPTSPPLTGEGARLQHRYIDGVLKDGSDATPAQPLWPWPMEQRIRDEMGISVTNLVASVVPDLVSAIADAERPFLAISPVMIAFGSVAVGTSSNSLLTLKNTGTARLSVTSYRWDAGGSPTFTLTAGGSCSNLPIALDPSQSCTLQVSFNPTDNLAQTSDLYFDSPELAPYPGLPHVFVSGIGTSKARMQ